MKTTSLSLPEWVFLDGHTHLGKELENRTVFMHVRSATVFEVFEYDAVVLSPKVTAKEFSFVNSYGITENLIIAVHFSIAELAELDAIVNKAITFYTDYQKWEDRNIDYDNQSKIN